MNLDKDTLNLPLKEKAAYAASLFQTTAVNKKNILKLRKKNNTSHFRESK